MDPEGFSLGFGVVSSDHIVFHVPDLVPCRRRACSLWVFETQPIIEEDVDHVSACLGY